MSLYVAVIGAGTPSTEQYENALAVGRFIAERGGIVVCGGLSGVMEAAARGATEAGGVAIGVLPGEDRKLANPYLTYSVATGTGQARNLAVVASGDVVISIGGEYGTLSEVGLAGKLQRRVVSLGSWDVGGHVEVATTPEEAVAAAYRLASV